MTLPRADRPRPGNRAKEYRHGQRVRIVGELRLVSAVAAFLSAGCSGLQPGPDVGGAHAAAAPKEGVR